MGVIADQLKSELTDPDFSEGYAESFLNAYIASQIKVLRRQRGYNQAELAQRIGTTQTAISRIENVNFSKWSIGTLRKVARALEVRLKVTFEEFGTLPNEVEAFSTVSLERMPRSTDPGLNQNLFEVSNHKTILGNMDRQSCQYQQGGVECAQHDSPNSGQAWLQKGAMLAAITPRQQSVNTHAFN